MYNLGKYSGVLFTIKEKIEKDNGIIVSNEGSMNHRALERNK
jgi:hypothetical protein